MKILASILLLMLFAGLAQAQWAERDSTQYWGCIPGDVWSGVEKPVLWLSIAGQNAGIVEIDGEQIKTAYGRKGLDRTWSWGLDQDNYFQYTVSLRSDGIALYYDFTKPKPKGDEEGEGMPPSQVFACRKSSPEDKKFWQKYP